MSSVTSLTPLPYPDPTDQPFVHLDLKALAEATTESLFVASATAPAHKPGRRWYNTTTKVSSLSDGTTWRQVPYAEYTVDATCNASGDFAGTFPAGTFTTTPRLQCTVQSNSQFTTANAAATSVTAFSGKAGYFPGGAGGISQTAGFVVTVRAVQWVGP